MQEIDLINSLPFLQLLCGLYILLGISNSLHPSLNLKKFINEAAFTNGNSVIEIAKLEYSKEVDNNKGVLINIIDGRSSKFWNAILIVFSNKAKKPKKPKFIKLYERVEFWKDQFIYDEESEKNKFKVSQLMSQCFLFFGINCFIILGIHSFVLWKKLNIIYQIFNIVSIIFITLFILEKLYIVYRFKFKLGLPSQKLTVLLQIVLSFLYILLIVILPVNYTFIHIDLNVYNLNNILLIILASFPIIYHTIIILWYSKCSDNLQKEYVSKYDQKNPAIKEPKEFS